MLLPELSASFLRRNTTTTVIAFFHRRRLEDLLLFSTATAGGSGENPSHKPHFLVEYLVSSCRFPPDQAAEVSKPISHLKSNEKPKSVVDFLRSHGFEDAHLRKLVSLNPRCLCYDVKKTLAPKMRAFLDMGFSPSDLPHLILSNPNVLNLSVDRILPKIELWKNLLGSTDLLMKFFKKNQWLLGYSVEKTILPNISLLRDCGITDERLAMIVRKRPTFITQRMESLRALVDRVEELKIPRSSGLFMWALQILRMVSRDRFQAKMELMKSFGWSESEFLAAFRKAPVFLSVSEKVMRRKMEFLVKEAGCETSYLALNPVLLMYSLEKRLIPRVRALEILKAKGLLRRKPKLHSIMSLSEEDFINKYVLCHKVEGPKLHKLYTAVLKQATPLS
ncbi:transcription termination factor MTERF15, mitochondrial-like [Phoenix dactylifera]|uniref:Transcription termination factor MTERF15, mitochondrial-like n=1 Tax=Phoenix dactylifera TaxID=42345 RepID=A0A8B7CQV2_PHODC|nr:transcription termination factor MTERF15, mitochondrial-like [Phoenix dactylifera]XP_008804494.2 transcription termination factor MTERF15, mitochondrial-like [Phoenix dactylifera]XP_008804495.2 transcription termination factor MTERF15, mitochondrial-like [Phoenix dactylifera]XP_026664515.2 transcription termination factor MTERF15, mitochondrial-like [Phoenix dactylifera]XP_038990225.1 transcription termination factor MTERF15, mitochondrial-like [Phoenix dactylifera]